MKLINSSKRYSIIDVDPDDLAAQLTLIDLPIFKSIQGAELVQSHSAHPAANGARQGRTPNVAAMRRQFNQVSFWVVGQILALDTARQRAELISHFIKTAKRLYVLNNLHSSNAIVSALLSSPIYRLEATWECVNKKHAKDKFQFNWLRQLYADTNNYESLRRHLDSCHLPCIPYLGMYSRDMIYIKEAHQEGTIQRTKSTLKILNSIERFQTSDYADLAPLPEVHSCLLSSRYIDELQRFIEDDNYRRSLELEPPDLCMNGGQQHAIDRAQAPGLHHSSSATSLARQPRSNMLAGLTSMVHSAMVSSYKFGSSSISPTPGNNKQSGHTAADKRYLIDDSFIHTTNRGNSGGGGGGGSDSCGATEQQHHTSFPPPISTSS